MKKLKWYGILFAIVVLFLYVMGIYDFPMMLTHNAQYYASKGYGELAVAYFSGYPWYLMIFWVLNLVCGVLSPVLYLMKKKYAYKVAFVSAIADLVLIILGVLFRNRIAALGLNIFLFDLFILVITILFWGFLKKSAKEM